MNTRLLPLCVIVLLSACSDRWNSPHAGGGGPPPPPPPPPPPTGGGGAVHQAFHLTAITPLADALHVAWEEEPGTAAAAELGVFVATDPGILFEGVPALVSAENGSGAISGLNTETTYFVGIAVRLPGQEWLPASPALIARTGAPVYADPAADPNIADGLTPGTAFNDVFLAVVTAFSQGGGNVFVAEGTFESVSFPLLEDVHLYGGFAQEFLPGERDPKAQPTHLNGLAGEYVIRIDSGGDTQVVEGFTIHGQNTVTNGIDISGATANLRFVTVERCTRGLSLRNSAFGPNFQITLYGCTLRENSLQGSSVKGALDVVVQDCDFFSNSGEGLDAGPLEAPDGGSASVRVRYSRFSGNGADGLDIDLNAPTGGGATGGLFLVEVQDCDFVGNGLTGCLIDLEYEQFPAWRSRIVVRGCRARSNASHGFHLDLDSHAEVFLHRLASSANRGDGLQLSSESQAGLATLSTSAMLANAGVGVRATFGNFPVLLSHCLIAGNLEGGAVSDTQTSVAVSSIAYLQPTAWAGVMRHHSLRLENALPLAFDYPPTQFLPVTAIQDATVSVSIAPNFGQGTIVELDDDESVREVLDLSSFAVELDPPPTLPAIVLSAFAGLDSVTEDWRLTDGSPARQAGMSAPGGTLEDAGIFGAPLAGEPGAEDLLPPALFFLANLSPGLSALPSNGELSLTFAGGEVDPASLNLGCFLVDASGTSLAFSARVEAGLLVLSPPVGGWQNGQWIQLFPALFSTDATPLSAPIAIPIL